MQQCDDSEHEKGPATRVFRGTYRSGFENSTFYPEGSKCFWWVSGDLGALGKELDRRWPYGEATATVQVEGTLTAPGCYGHMGVARRELTVKKVVSFDIKNVIPMPTMPRGQ
jgi:hypothetical protein